MNIINKINACLSIYINDLTVYILKMNGSLK